MDLSFISNNIHVILSGVSVTMSLMISALVVGFTMALIMTLLAETSIKSLKAPINTYLFLIRGTPMLLQFFLIYYGAAQFEWVRDSFLWVAFKSPFVCAVLALAINTSAYTTVLLRGAIESVPRGEKEVCHVLGLSRFQGLFHIVLPHAMRIALPAYSNEVIMILKGTSLASTITLLDLTGVTHQIASKTYQYIPVFLMAGLIYLIINMIIGRLFYAAETRLSRHMAK